ncbi:MAG TPA: helix-hairpin-helix domain-containing protein, partial [Bacteroidales bacterium]|nr:helix-hairpin-helix domain-containing protein [Bacteroidales bacterium]
MSRQPLPRFLLIPLILILLFGPVRRSTAQPDPGYVILVPTGATFQGYPVLKPLDHQDPRSALGKKIFEGTFVREIVRINGCVQRYLAATGGMKNPEPAYLLLSGRIGGFPMHGFYLKEGKKITDKTSASYVDLKEMEKDYGRLSSITQIFPHEQVHLFYSQLTGIRPDSTPSYSSDIHYYSIVTDYYKAFNEGFAESFENVSRMNEPDAEVRAGTQKDLAAFGTRLQGKIAGYDRDYRWPLRFGFYNATLLLWYQQLEDYKRAAWSEQNLAGLKAAGYESTHPDRAIAYRNACVLTDPGKYRNAAQSAATEGVICTFFTKVMQSDLKEQWAPREFYLPFVSDTGTFGKPSDYFTPVENQILKELYILHKYLHGIKENESPFYEFIRGYMMEFPAEKEKILSIFREVTSHPFLYPSPPELWVLNRDHRHRNLVMAPYGGSESGWYTFNLNTCGPEDLMTFRGVSRNDAVRVISYRDSSSGFRSFNDLLLIPGVQPGTSAILAENRLDPSVLKKLDNEEESFSIPMIILHQLKPFISAALILTLITTTVLFFAFYLNRKSWRRSLRMLLRTLGKSFLFIFLILASFVLGFPP